MAGFTKKSMEAIVNETRTFGECFLGNVSFDTIKDSRKWHKFLRENRIEDCFLARRDEGSHNDGWFLVCVC